MHGVKGRCGFVSSLTFVRDTNGAVADSHELESRTRQVISCKFGNRADGAVLPKINNFLRTNTTLIIRHLSLCDHVEPFPIIICTSGWSSSGKARAWCRDQHAGGITERGSICQPASQYAYWIHPLIISRRRRWITAAPDNTARAADRHRRFAAVDPVRLTKNGQFVVQ